MFLFGKLLNGLYWFEGLITLWLNITSVFYYHHNKTIVLRNNNNKTKKNKLSFGTDNLH